MEGKNKSASARGRSSRRKGREGELAALKWLHARGMVCERTREFAGDIILSHPPPWFPGTFYLLEIKFHQRVERGILVKVLQDGKWFVMWRESRRPWTVSMRLPIFLTLLGIGVNMVAQGDAAYGIIVSITAEDFVKLWLEKEQ